MQENNLKWETTQWAFFFFVFFWWFLTKGYLPSQLWRKLLWSPWLMRRTLGPGPTRSHQEHWEMQSGCWHRGCILDSGCISDSHLLAALTGGVGAVGVTEGGGGLAGGPGRAGGPPEAAGGGGFAGGAAGAEAGAAGEVVLLAVASWDKSQQRWLHVTLTQQVFHTKVHKLNTESGYVWVFKGCLP